MKFRLCVVVTVCLISYIVTFQYSFLENGLAKMVSTIFIANGEGGNVASHLRNSDSANASKSSLASESKLWTVGSSPSSRNSNRTSLSGAIDFNSGAAFTTEELYKLYGTRSLRQPHERDLDTLLKFWDRAAASLSLNYSLTYGSYVAWLRQRSYTPYDTDIDIHIGASGVRKLFAESLQTQGISNVASGLSTKPMPSDAPQILLNEYHDLPDAERPRHDCHGKRVGSMVDSCAFNGPVARVVSRAMTVLIDVYVYCDSLLGCDVDQGATCDDKFDGHYGGHAKRRRFCVFIPTKAGSELPPVRRCSMHNIETMCFASPETIKPMLEGFYGDTFLIPDKRWSGAGWVKRK